MQLETMMCPECGAQLHFEEDQEFCFCSHCGTQVFLNDPNSKKITHIIKDESAHYDMQKRSLDLEMMAKQEEYKIRRIKIRIIISAVIFVVYLVICGFVYGFWGKDGLTTFFAFSALMGILVLLYSKF